jgi:pimeloyl-ACP methyl ester carboxylesterase
MADLVRSASGLAYRVAGPEDGPSVLMVHGYPESSYMWRDLLDELGETGFRAYAPDLAGFGDSPADPPGTWERHVESLERFATELGIGPTVLVVHDWGGLIGLRWACDHPARIRALVISSTGFFGDGKWHGLADVMRTDGQGEELMAQMTRESFGGLLEQASPGIDDAAVDEYWKAFADEERRRGQLELYRSGDMEKLTAYDGKLAALGVPTLILWGETDAFAPVAGAYRFHQEIEGSELEILDAGHFVWEEAPARCTEALLEFAQGLEA